MSRSGYTDDYDEGGQFARWRGIVASATRGKRGQKFFRDLLTVLDAMPIKRLVAAEFQTEEGDACALGALGKARGSSLSGILTTDEFGFVDCDHRKLGTLFNIAEQLAQETMWINDEAGPYGGETDEQRWTRVRAWAAQQIRVTPEELP
jgi:hypothetical protein